MELSLEEKKAIKWLEKAEFFSERLYAPIILNLIEKQREEIEELKKNSIGDTKSEKLLFSIRMLHFHNYITDKQFYEMIKKLSNIGE